MKAVKAFIVGCFALLSVGGVSAQSVDYLNSILWTGCNDVVTGDGYAYGNFTNGLMVIDENDPTAPVQINQTPLPNAQREFYYSNQKLFVAGAGHDFEVFDLSDPTEPMPMGSFETERAARFTVVDENYAYLVVQWTDDETQDDYNEIVVLDISNPTNPAEVSRFHAYFRLPISDIFTSDTLAYVTYAGSRLIEGYHINFGGLAIFSLADISNPQIRTDYQTNDTGYRSVYVVNNHAYVTHSDNGLMVFVAFYPSTLILEGSLPIDGLARDVVIKDDYALVSDGSADLYIIDISVPAEPELTGVFSADYAINNLSLMNDHIFTNDVHYGIQEIDVGDLPEVAYAGVFLTPYMVNNSFIHDGLAYISLDNSGLQIYDVADPADPFFVGLHDSDSRPQDVFVAGEYAYIADLSAGLQIVDISNPATPELQSTFAFPQGVYQVSVRGEFAYVAAGLSGFWIVNVADPQNPQPAGHLIYQGFSKDVAIAGDYAYVPADAFGLRIIDISNQNEPQLIGTYNTPGSATAVALAGHYACVADGWNGNFHIIGVADPENPELMSTIDLPGAAADVFVEGDYAYVASGDLYVIDISDPGNPTIAAGYETPYYASGVFGADGNIYVADQTSLLILHFDETTGIISEVQNLPQKFTVLQNFPNPFNASTTIEFGLPGAGHVKLDIYDVLGRRVTNLVDAEKSAGYHRVLWNAADVASGIYLYRLQTDTEATDRRMLLIK